MKDLFQPIFDSKNQVIFCTLGFTWISCASPWTTSPFLIRALLYPPAILILFFLILLFFRIRKVTNYLGKFLSPVFFLYIATGILCIFRGVYPDLSHDSIRESLFSNTASAIVWLMPIVIIYSLPLKFWKYSLKKIKTSVLMGLIIVSIMLILQLATGIVYEDSMYNSTDLLFLAPLLVVISTYQRGKDFWVGLSGIIVLCLHMLLVGERFAIAYTGLICLFYLLFLITRKGIVKYVIKVIPMAIIVFSVFGLVFTTSSTLSNYYERYFSQGEMWKDTRGDLAAHVTKDMSDIEKFFGRGNFGTYIWGSRGWPPVPYIRVNVEIGYMQLILKGGYLMLGLFLLISFYAVYLGLFRSKNNFTKYMAFMILSRLIIMLTAMSPRVGFEYFTYWIIIGGCLSPGLRSLKNQDIMTFLQQTRRTTIRW